MPWLRGRLHAAWVLFRYPQLSVAVATSVAVVAAIAAVAPLFIHAAQEAAFDREIADLTSYALGFEVDVRAQPRDFGAAPDVETELRSWTAALPEVAHPETTVITPPVHLDTDGSLQRVRLLARDGVPDHVELLRGDFPESDDGVMIPGSLADGLQPGDALELTHAGTMAAVPVSGVYEIPNKPDPEASFAAFDDYWRPFTFRIIPARAPPIGVAPPPLIIGPQPLIEEVARALEVSAYYEWRMPVMSTVDVDAAQRLATAYAAAGRRLADDDDPLGQAVRELREFVVTTSSESELPAVLSRVTDAATSLRGSVTLLTLAAGVIALVVVAAAGAFMVRIRRFELRRAWAHGVSPWRLGAQASAEAAVPAVVGGVVGWVSAQLLVANLGPEGGLDPGASRAALLDAGVAVVVALAFLGVLVGVVVHDRFVAEHGRLRAALPRMPWEAIVLAFAGVSLYEIVSRGTTLVDEAGQTPEVDLLLVAFPFLALLGAAGLGARLFQRTVPVLRRGLRRARASVYLATRRLAGASGVALLLVGGLVLAVGLATYASAVVASTRASVDLKATVAVGAETVAVIPQGSSLDVDDLGFPATRVVTLRAEVAPPGRTVDLVAVDPGSFDEVVDWHPRLSPRALPTLLAELGDVPSTAPFPAFTVGGALPAEGIVGSSTFEIDYRSVERFDAFPGLEERPLVVVSRETLARSVQESSIPQQLVETHEIWATAPSDEVVRTLAGRGVPALDVDTAEDVRSSSSLLTLDWTFGLFEAIGVGAVVLALTSLLLYVQSRQTDTYLSYALARRMGLSRRQHLAALVLELSGLVTAGTLLGSLAGAAVAWLLNANLDPLPSLPPDPVFEISVVRLLVGWVLALAFAVIGAATVQWRAERVDVAEVIRLAR